MPVNHRKRAGGLREKRKSSDAMKLEGLRVPTDPRPLPPLDEEIKDKFVLKRTNSSGELSVFTVMGRSLKKVQEIGRGRYGSVDLMREPQSGIEMAVKRIRESTEVQDFRYIQREVRASLEGGECPFLVKCYGVMRLEGDVWICMEVMSSSLDRFYKFSFDMETRIPEVFLGRIAFSMIRGLDFLAKELHLMHRDVKPTNVLLDKEGRVKLCDYGVSGALESNGPTKTIKAGCLPYMGPERIDADDPAYDQYDERSDVWSLGISLYEIAKGTHPYIDRKSPFQQMVEVLKQPAPRLSEPLPYSKTFKEFVHLCLNKDFTIRPKYSDLLETPFVLQYLEKAKSPTYEEEIRSFASSLLNQMASNDIGSIRQVST